MKAKTKIKRKGLEKGKIKHQNAENDQSEATDLSQLRKPVDTHLSNLKQVVQVFEKGSDEAKEILTYECNVIYECRSCRSLFRSLANLISHKRLYCQERYSVATSDHILKNTQLIHDRDEVEKSKIENIHETGENQKSVRGLRRQPTKNYPKKDLTSVVDMLVQRQNEDSNGNTSQLKSFEITKNNNEIYLEMINTKQAVYQTIAHQDISENIDFMQSQVLELTSMLNRNTAVLEANNQFSDACEPPPTLSDLPSLHQINAPVNSAIDKICTYCHAKFSTKKTLHLHIKRLHTPYQICYSCPCCTSIFSSRCSVYRHLFKFHRKTNQNVRRLRSQIRAVKKMNRVKNPVGMNKPRIEKNRRKNGTENPPLHLELYHCGRCGKYIERKAALRSHLAVCPKKVRAAESQESPRPTKLRKILPEIPNETKETPSIINEDDNAISQELGELRIDDSDKTSNTSSIASLKSSLSLVSRTSTGSPSEKSSMNKAPSTDEKSLTSDVCDGGAVHLRSDEMVVIPNIDERKMLPSIPAEISIRVEGVSTVSKDVWEKMGTFEEETESASTKSAPSNLPSVIPVSPSKLLEMQKALTEPDVITDNSSIPEVIYTSFENSRPVNLSVLSTEDKLGIQYRGIKLPTVTLEKIKVSKAEVKEENTEPEVVIRVARRKSKSKSKVSEPPRFPCTTCGRKYKTLVALQRHIVVHIKRLHYRCKMCHNFTSLLKCDIFKHCYSEHGVRPNQYPSSKLAEEFKLPDSDPAVKDTWCDDLLGKSTEPEFVDVDRPLKNLSNEITVAKLSEIKEELVSKPVKRKAGRPRKHKSKVKKRKTPRHVSPPRLSDESSDDMNKIDSSIVVSVENDDKNSLRKRAPSRMETDPELRKMVMNVIFGTTGDEEQYPLDQNEKDSAERFDIFDDLKQSRDMDSS